MHIHTHPWYHQHHHNGNGFRNIWGPPREESFWKAAGWLVGHAFQQKDNRLPPVQPIDLSLLTLPPERVRITWIGHATTLLQTAAFTLLTDPVFGHRVSPLPFAGPTRQTPPALRLADLPPIDLVLLSHDHYDHLDVQSIRTLVQQHDPLFFVPLGVGRLVRSLGATRVFELDWWQYVDLNGWRFHCTPAKHFSGRGLTNRDGTLWAGWYLAALDTDQTLYFAGDSGYADLFTTIRERLGAPEVALLPIGAYRPRWFMEGVHVDPSQAVQAFLDLQAQYFIPIHWGTFDLADEPLQEPPELLLQAATEQNVADRVHLLDIGGAFSLP